MTRLGLDIGYSNLKLAISRPDGSSRFSLLPSGAAPLSKLPQRLDDSKKREGYRVLVDDEQYAVGIPQSKFQNWNRVLHDDYPSTLPYRALFHAALLACESNTVDVVVTGLPVDQFLDKRKRETVRARMCGAHRVSSERRVTVLSAKVAPQPVGAYLDLTYSTDNVEALQEARVLVLDPGFFSVDWVVIEAGDLHQSLSGSNQMAASMILEEIQRRIGHDLGGQISLGKIEHAVRSGKTSILLFGERIDLGQYARLATQTVVPVAIDALRQSMRGDADSIDIVLVAGGGADFYADAATALFPQSKVIVPDNPVMANVRGFARLAANARA